MSREDEPVVIEDWRGPIVEMVMAKQALAAWDPRGIFPHRFPGVAAPPEAVDAAEAALGVRLDPEHRALLGHADGWEAFHQHVTLLGTDELTAGRLRDAGLDAVDHADEPLRLLGCSPELLLPIAASLEQADVFVMPIRDGLVGRRVHWLAEGEVIDSFVSFGQFFVSMIDYTTRRAARLRATAEGRREG